MVTYRARDRSHTLRAFARSGPWAGERAWRVDERSRHENGQTRPDRRRRLTSSSSPSPDGFSKTSAPALAPAARDAPLVPDATTSVIFFLCRSPRKRGGGPRVLGRAARLTEGPLKPRSGPPLLSLSHRESSERLAETGARYIRKRSESVRYANAERKTITLNGGSLGSWVDEERS